MRRKVFISFLGTSIYDETYYYDNDKDKMTVEPTRFIQVATLSRHASHFSKDDKIYIFTTEGALKNWNDNHHFNPKTQENIYYDGLNKCISHLNFSAAVKNVMIPDGKSTDEIWQIFQKVFDLIEDNDELIFDITHGFRSLPMLNMVLINYAKLLRNISVCGIYYGAFDAKEVLDGKTFSPIWNLIDFEHLQDWTNAAQLFLKAGSAERLSQMMKTRSIIGHYQINNFAEEILSNRGINLTKGDSAIAIKNILIEAKDKEIHPVVRPLFELIEKQFSDYREKSVLNGLYAVKWCVDHDLIQQGYTLMSEFLPTYVLNYIGEDFVDKDARNTINGLLGIKGKKDKFKFDEKIREKQDSIIDRSLKIPYFEQLCKRNRSINAENRDDINHAGFRKKPKDYLTLKDELRDKYEKLKDVILKIENNT